MTKEYILIHKSELTYSLVAGLQCSVDDLRVIYALDIDGVLTDEDTGWRLYHIKNACSEVIKHYKRLSKDQARTAIDKISTGISYQNKIKQPTHLSAFLESEGKRFRGKGIFKLTIAAGATVSQDYLLTEERLLDAGHIKGYNTNFGDNITFEIVHPENGVLDTFLENWYVRDDPCKIHVYPTLVPAGLILRLTYNNVGAGEAKIIINGFLHKV